MPVTAMKAITNGAITNTAVLFKLSSMYILTSQFMVVYTLNIFG